MRIGIYPGTFDPITNGHVDIIKRASKLFDKLYVCVAHNIQKETFFTEAQRLTMVKAACEEYKNIEVIASSDLIVNIAKKLHCDAIVRGLRAVSDFEYEFAYAAGNEYLDNSIEMVFLMASSNTSFISSSAIKEFRYHDVDVSKLVPKIVVEYFSIRERELNIIKK